MFAKKRRRIWPWVLASGLVVAGAVTYKLTRSTAVAHRYVTGHASRGDVIESIEATGTVQAVTQVQVSSQVSGRILRLHADYNARVHAGDVLAELDPTPFRARVQQAQASMQQAIATQRKAEADLTLAQANANRARRMREHELNAQADLDVAINSEADSSAQVGVARAGVAQARAALSVAQTDLDYTQIRAPIDGIVITRSIDVGQTVAASFSAPVLFVIVDDLARVQIVGDVDEAEIGKLRTSMQVAVRVDAFPDQVFHGRIRELRYGSTVTQGIVTYPAVIDVDNPERALRPGMTAAISVTAERAQNTLRVPNAALRFQPHDESQPAATPARRRSSHEGVVWVLEGRGPAARIRQVTVGLGATDGRYTAIRSGSLNVGDAVVLDDAGATGAPGAAPRRGPRIL